MFNKAYKLVLANFTVVAPCLARNNCIQMLEMLMSDDQLVLTNKNKVLAVIKSMEQPLQDMLLPHVRQSLLQSCECKPRERPHTGLDLPWDQFSAYVLFQDVSKALDVLCWEQCFCWIDVWYSD